MCLVEVRIGKVKQRKSPAWKSQTQTYFGWDWSRLCLRLFWKLSESMQSTKFCGRSSCHASGQQAGRGIGNVLQHLSPQSPHAEKQGVGASRGRQWLNHTDNCMQTPPCLPHLLPCVTNTACTLSTKKTIWLKRVSSDRGDTHAWNCHLAWQSGILQVCWGPW
jgi:hypothetical protein